MNKSCETCAHRYTPNNKPPCDVCAGDNTYSLWLDGSVTPAQRADMDETAGIKPSDMLVGAGAPAPDINAAVERWLNTPVAIGHSSIMFPVAGYERLADVLQAAYDQASAGKGAERHAAPGQPFHEQPICAINRLHGSIDGALFQAAKKAHEARNLPTKRAAVAEILGAINYLAACAILIDEGIIGGQV